MNNLAYPQYRMKQSFFTPAGACSRASRPGPCFAVRVSHLKFFGSNAVVSCDEAEARNLLHMPAIARA